jgi:hypothetical protein
MAKCPVCEHVVATPFFLNVDAWRWLVCPHCATRLEKKKPCFVVAMMALWPGLIALTRFQGHRFAVFADVFMVAAVMVMLVEFMRSQLRLRKPPPKPEIRLNIGGPSNE